MVFNKLPKEMRRTLALTLAASMVATGTQTPVLADQVQEVSVQEVQNAQTEAGEEQNVRAAEQQEEVPVAEEQTGTDKSVQSRRCLQMRSTRLILLQIRMGRKARLKHRQQKRKKLRLRQQMEKLPVLHM